MLLERLADVLTFEQVHEDRYVAYFGDKVPTLAERASDDRLPDSPEVPDDSPFIGGGYLLALAVVVSGGTVDDELVPFSTHSAIPRAGDANEPHPDHR